MRLVANHQGFEICRTTAGHLVVVNPLCSSADRVGLVRFLAAAGALDALFFPTLADALDAIDEMVAKEAGKG